MCTYTHKRKRLDSISSDKVSGGTQRGSEGGETRKYQNLLREKTLAAEILGILVTSNGNVGAFLKPPPDRPPSAAYHSPTLHLLLTHGKREGKNEEIKVVTCWANHNIDSLVPSRIIKCFALTT